MARDVSNAPPGWEGSKDWDDLSVGYREQTWRAHEHGYDSIYQQTSERERIRDEYGVDDVGDIDRISAWERDFDSGEWDRETLQGIYEELFGYYDEADFYDWLAELYEKID